MVWRKDILLAYEFLKLGLVCVRQPELVDLGFAQIDDFLIEGVHHDLIVAIHGAFGEGKHQPLRNVVFPPKVGARVSQLFWVLERVIFWKQVTAKRLILITLRRVYHLRYHDGLFRFVHSHSTKKLVFVDEC